MQEKKKNIASTLEACSVTFPDYSPILLPLPRGNHYPDTYNYFLAFLTTCTYTLNILVCIFLNFNE